MSAISQAIDPQEISRKKSVSKVYTTLWRWHFYAGLFVSPFLCILAITGSLLIFEPELIHLANHGAVIVQPGATIQPLSKQIDAALKAHPGTIPEGIAIRKRNQAAEIDLRPIAEDSKNRKEPIHAFVNPYTAQYLGDGGWMERFLLWDREVHTSLLSGRNGSIIMECAASWTVILVITGFYLWWPRKSSKLWGVWLPRLRKGSRLLVRDLHVVPGFYLMVGLGVLALTGLSFTPIWGGIYRSLDSGFPRGFEHPPVSTPADTQTSIDDAYQKALSLGFHVPEIYLSFPEGKTGTWRVISYNDAPPYDWGVVWIDQYHNKILELAAPSKAPLMGRIHWLAYLIHTGAVLGTATKVVALITCIGSLLLVITGVWMWWRRRPSGQSGFPKSQPAPPSLILLALLCGIALPTMGITFLLLWSISALYRKISLMRLKRFD